MALPAADPRVHVHDVVAVVPEGLHVGGKLEVDLDVLHHPQHVENLGLLPRQRWPEGDEV